MRIIGIDYGSKRIGLALSDEAGQFALPVEVIETKTDPVKYLKEFAKNNQVSEVVIGESKDYAGKDNKIQSSVEDFKKALESAGFLVHFEPEFMTSLQVERLQGKNDKIDASAAAIILQSFLDKKNNSK